MDIDQIAVDDNPPGEINGVFIRRYKDLEAGKWVGVMLWADAAEAMEMLRQAIARAGSKRAHS